MASAARYQPADVTVTITITAAPGNPSPGNVLANAQKRDLCNVVVAVPFNKISFLSGKYLKNRTLTGQCAMRHE